jgi:hypothetical protein
MCSGGETLPYLDKTLPEAGKAPTAYATVVSKEALRQGPACTESELIKLRVSQLNGCLSVLIYIAGRAGMPASHSRSSSCYRRSETRPSSASGKQPCSR